MTAKDQSKLVTTSYRFVPDAISVGHVPVFSFTDIEQEPQLYSASRLFAAQRGGPITTAILAAMPDDAWQPAPDRYIVIDTRSHMLMPGMYPAIPGWHCDAWPRTNAGEGQPDPTNTADKAGVRHWAVSVGDCSQTEFLGFPIELELRPDAVWAGVSEEIGTPHGRWFQPAQTIYAFGPDQLHRASPATARGWRFWLRLSHYQRPPLNRVRSQTQVYLTEHGGW